jgi:hypothetical protein
MAKYQQKVAQGQARDAIDRGQAAEDAHRRKVAQFAGKQRATMGASGVELTSGSFADVLQDTAMLGELDALTIRSNAQREAYGYQSQAAVSGYEASAAKTAGWMNAGGSLLSGASNLASGNLVHPRHYDSRSALNQFEGPPSFLMNRG